MKPAATLFRIDVSSKKLPPRSSKFFYPALVFRTVLRFEFPPEFLRQCWALARCRNRNLKLTTADHRWIIEIAVFGIIHDVAEHVARLGLAENRFVHVLRGRSHNHEKDVIKIERRELSLFPANRACARPLLHGSVGTRCDNTNHSTGEQKTVNFSLGYRSCANNQARPIL